MTSSSEGLRGVLYFKKDLLPYSETFITEQARHLSGYRASYAAFRKVESGIGLLGDRPRVFLDGLSLSGFFRRTALRCGVLSRSWKQRLAELDCDLIHAQFGHSGVAALPLARGLGKPLVCTFHGMDITAQASLVYQAGRRRLYREAAAVIAVAEHIREKLVEDGCPGEKAHFCPIGIDPDRFSGERHPDPAPTVAFIGRFVEKKGLVHVLRVIPRILERLPSTRFEFLGGGSLRPEVCGMVERFPENVFFHGPGSPADVAALLRRSWILLGPSTIAANGDSEGLPTVHTEAQAAGVPPVGFVAPGVEEAVVDGQTGSLVSLGDEDGLVEAAVRLLKDSGLRHRFGKAGRERVQRHFDIRQCTKRLEAVYDRVIGHHSPAP